MPSPPPLPQGDGADSARPALNLNVNATPFVPNVNAAPFFPRTTTTTTTSTPAAPTATTTSSAKATKTTTNPATSAINPNNVAAAPAADADDGKTTPAAIETLSSDLAAALPDTATASASATDTASAVGKDRLNIIFIGHVDAGKSTMGGNILYLTGMVDQRTIEKFQRESREAGRESWYLSWALDTNDDERARGKTVETGRAFFETLTRKYTILDAPGHKNYVPNMIQGAAQADVAILVISARRGEFETGFEGGGQTREHAMLVKTAGVRRLIVAVNKMDDPTVEWSQARYNECCEKLMPYLRRECKYNVKTDVDFIPVSGFSGANLVSRVDPDICPFYSGPSLVELLDSIPTDSQMLAASLPTAPLIVPISSRFNDMGVVACGKIESGVIRKNMQIAIVPNVQRAQRVEVAQIVVDGNEVDVANAGDTVSLKLKGGIKEEEIFMGSVICNPSICVLPTVTTFDAQLLVVDTDRIITAGYTAVIHIHNATVETTITRLLHSVDKKTGRMTRKPPRFINKGDVCIVQFKTNLHPICIDLFKCTPQLGRFTVRNNTMTVAMGKVLKLVN